MLEIVSELRERDEDHFVRAGAARALARCDTPGARVALRAALLDRSVTVQEAAEQSLKALEAGLSPKEPRVSDAMMFIPVLGSREDDHFSSGLPREADVSEGRH